MMMKLIFGISSILYVWTMATSSSSYFERTYGEEIRQGLQKEFFQCDREKSCTNVVKTKNGKLETINDEKELRKRKDVVSIWKKIEMGKETPGKTLFPFFVVLKLR